MKATLKHIANQYILIVDERPKIGDWSYNRISDSIWYNNFNETYLYGEHKIIAAENLDGVKGIRFKCYDTETNRYIITSKPKEYVKPYIDTEVEVTEEENYWVVRL